MKAFFTYFDQILVFFVFHFFSLFHQTHAHLSSPSNKSETNKKIIHSKYVENVNQKIKQIRKFRKKKTNSSPTEWNSKNNKMFYDTIFKL